MADDRKGKSKAPSSTAPAQTSDERSQSSNSNAGGSAAQTLASALRTTMASSQLSSVMQSVGAGGGKEGFQSTASGGGGGGGELRDWLVQDLRGAAGGSDVGAAGSSASNGVQGFRSQAGGRAAAGQREGEKMFEEFQRGLRIGDSSGGGSTPRDAGSMDALNSIGGMEQSWDEQRARWAGLDPTSANPIQTYSQLDAPLHASVRTDHSQTSAQPASLHQTATPEATAPLTQSDDIFALLDAESQPQPSTTTPQPPEADLSSAVLSQFDPLYRPPSPSHASFTREQAALHLSLAEAQASAQGQQDLVIPRPDNPALHEGVYAATPEAALSSIFGNGREESTDATETESVDDRGRAVIRKITRWFGASSYIDDVYGVSPVLRETMDEVVKKDNSEENREKAVRRLESLWRHLSDSGPKIENQGADWVDGWLLKNT